MAQRSLRGDGAPMRPGKSRHGEPEGGPGALRISLGGGTEGAEAGVELGTGRQHHHVALEGGEAEEGGQGFESRRAAIDLESLHGRLVLPGCAGAGGPALEQPPHAGEGLLQVAVVGRVPAHRGAPFPLRSAVGPVYWPKVGLAGAASVMSGLSAPSTWRRTR